MCLWQKNKYSNPLQLVEQRAELGGQLAQLLMDGIEPLHLSTLHRCQAGEPHGLHIGKPPDTLLYIWAAEYPLSSDRVD